jgi:hypothetical protein
MSENPEVDSLQHDVPAPPPDDENEAIIDAQKTFVITVVGAVLFCLAALFIIMATRMG